MQPKRGDVLTVCRNKNLLLLRLKYFPTQLPAESLSAGEIGYIVTGIKKGIASVGDTITQDKNPLPALEGYMTPRPVVWRHFILKVKMILTSFLRFFRKNLNFLIRL